MPVSPLYIEPLDPNKHRREAFDCGVEALNDYLRKQARKEVAAGISACFVAVPQSEPSCVAGFYTLSASIITRTALPENVTQKLPRYQELPATLLCRLARSVDFNGQLVGSRLMVSAINRAVEGAKQVASWALVTDPKGDKARAFYEGFGFRALTSTRMFLTLQEATLLTVR